MTYVEFFDEISVRNIVSCLASEPDKVIFVGENRKKMERYKLIYQKLFENRGRTIDFAVRGVISKNLESMLAALSEIIEANGECIFDLEGGDAMTFVAVGMMYERYGKERVKLQRVSLVKNTVHVDETEIPISPLSVEEYLHAYAADIIYDDVSPGGTHRWEITEEFKADIDAAWEICRNDCSLWNREIGELLLAEKYKRPTDDPLYVRAYFSDIGSRIDISILNDLYRAGLVIGYSRDGEKICFRYKSNQVRQLLSKGGQALEMKIYTVAMFQDDNRGNLLYNDVMNGVCIDWDGGAADSNQAVDVENEIDVMMMKGIVPIFISCKSGKVTVDELYKLNTVANRFGKGIAKKVIVVTDLEHAGEGFAAFFHNRAQGMGITVVDNIHTKTDKELSQIFKNIWRT